MVQGRASAPPPVASLPRTLRHRTEPPFLYNTPFGTLCYFVSLFRSCCALLAFILPTLCYAKLEKDAGFPLSPGRKLLHNFILAAGLFAMISGTLDTLHRIGLEYTKGDEST